MYKLFCLEQEEENKNNDEKKEYFNIDLNQINNIYKKDLNEEEACNDFKQLIESKKKKL